MASGRLAYQHMDESDAMPAAKRRKTVSSRVERPRGVAAQFRQTDVSDVQEVSVCVCIDGYVVCEVTTAFYVYQWSYVSLLREAAAEANLGCSLSSHN